MPRALILGPRRRSRVSRLVKGSYAEDQRPVALIQVLEQKYQQDTCHPTGRPHHPIEHLVVAGVVALVAASHDAERRGRGALTRGQDRSHQQELGLLPGRVGEQRGEGKQNGYNGIGQGEHGWAFCEKWGQASLPCLYTFSKFCVNSSLGLAKEGARRHNYASQRGYHPLLAIAAGTGDVLMARVAPGTGQHRARRGALPA